MEKAEYKWVGLVTVLHGLDVFRLFLGFPEGIKSWDQGLREVKEHDGDGLRGVSREKGREWSVGQYSNPEADSVTVGRENKLHELRDKLLFNRSVLSAN